MIPITVTVRSVPVNYEPPNDMQGVLEAVAQYTDYEAQADGPGIVISSTGVETEPDTGAQIGADPNGIFVWTPGPAPGVAGLSPRPMAWYRNSWWNVYTGQPGEIRYFIGAPQSYFDGTGLGLDWSGWEGWALCNGNNNTIDLGARFIVPGYRYDSTQGWITQLGSVLDVGGGAPTPTWPFGVGGGGYGPGFSFDWLSKVFDPSSAPQLFAQNFYPYTALIKNVTDITAPIDLVWGGWAHMQFGYWNFSSNDPPIQTTTVPSWPGLNVDFATQTKSQSIQFGKDPTVHWPGGATSAYYPGPIDTLYDAGTWTYQIDQNPQFQNSIMSRLPPYIAVGLVQFLGYA